MGSKGLVAKTATSSLRETQPTKQRVIQAQREPNSLTTTRLLPLNRAVGDPGRGAQDRGDQRPGDSSASDQDAMPPDRGSTANDLPGDGSKPDTGEEASTSDRQQPSDTAAQDTPAASESSSNATESTANDSGDASAGDRPQPSHPQPGNTSQSNSSTNRSSAGDPSKVGNPNASGNASGQPLDGGDAGEGASGDDANLEFAREATDLVLEYLRDQKQQPDSQLLDKLGWKPQDVDKFVRRWDEMKRNAKGADPISKQNKSKLDEILKGMGLQSPNSQLRRAGDNQDQQRNNRNTGRQRNVPADLLDPFRAFQRSLREAD